MADQALTDQETLEQVAQRLDQLVQAFEEHPNIPLRQQVMEMLSLVDALHRQGLQRLVEVLQTQNPALLDQALQEPSVRLLLTLYELMPPESHEQVKAGNIPGFRSVEMHEPVKAPARSGSFIPLQQVSPMIRKVKHPVYTEVMPLESLPAGTLKGVEVEGARILLCNLDGEVYAYRNACPGSILPLDAGKLEGYTLLCPWHNCRYDVRTGKRLDGGSGHLMVIPVALRDGMIQLALSVEQVPLHARKASEGQ